MCGCRIDYETPKGATHDRRPLSGGLLSSSQKVGEGHLEIFKLLGKIAISGADEAKNEIDETTEHAERKSSKLLKALGTVGKWAIAGTGAAALYVGKNALTAYADYEQLVGGVETLFGARGAKSVEEYAKLVGKSVDEVTDEYETLKLAEDTMMAQAEQAWKYQGMSVNEYMETATGFAAALTSSCEDAVTAAELADVAIGDMSDNANKMGSDITSIQNAYQGFAKQNYTMLDNLKLGYGGTKEEMQRLISDANKLREAQGLAGDLTIDKYSDVVKAIHMVQVEMGIYGTTSKEAASTIQGSISMMKGAWKNLLVGIADENADFKTLTSNFVDSLVAVGENIIPRINTIIQGATQLISQASQTIVPLVVQTLLENLPSIIAAGMDLVIALVNGVLDNIDLLIDCVLEVVDVIVDKLIENLPKLIDGGFKLIVALANGLIKAIPQLAAKVPQIIYTIVKSLVRGIPDIMNVGKDLIRGLWNGIKSMGDWLWSCVKGFFGGIVDGVKNFLGIHSPSKVFAGIGGFMAEGLGEGFDDQFKSVKKDIESSMNFDAANASINVSSNIQKQVGSGASPATQTAQGGNDRSIHLTVVAPNGKELARFIAPYMGAQLQLVRG